MRIRDRNQNAKRVQFYCKSKTENGKCNMQKIKSKKQREEENNVEIQ